MKVILYHQDACDRLWQYRQVLDHCHQPYEERTIGVDPFYHSAITRMLDQTHKPVLMVDEMTLCGLEPRELEEWFREHDEGHKGHRKGPDEHGDPDVRFF